MGLDLEQVAVLIREISELDCSEVDLSIGDARLIVRKSRTQGFPSSDEPAPPRTATVGDECARDDAMPNTEVTIAPFSENSSADPVAEWLEREASGSIDIIRSPMVGTSYLAEKPGAAPFVEVGAPIAAGATICIVEVMKLFHSIAAETNGIVRAIFVADAQVVEYGQPLIAIEPA